MNEAYEPVKQLKYKLKIQKTIDSYPQEKKLLPKIKRNSTQLFIFLQNNMLDIIN